MKSSMAQLAGPCVKVLYNLRQGDFFLTYAKAVFQISCAEYNIELSIFAQVRS